MKNLFKGLVSLSLASLLIIFGISYFPELFKLNYEVIEMSASVMEVVEYALNQTNTKEFEGFNNNTGADHFVVPNIVHYVRFNQKRWTFSEYICLRSAYVNQRPDYILIHTDVDEFKGKYWNWMQREPDLRKRIVRVPSQPPDNIFGQEFQPIWKLYHGSDVARLRILMKYGGFYFDNDVYVANNLDKYRKFEMTVGWPKNESLGNMVLIASKDARFLKLWLNEYHNYKKDLWYYNSGDGPTANILSKHPELVHREETRLGVKFMINELYKSSDYPWRQNLDTVHLLTKHRIYLDMNNIKLYNYFNERNILHYPFTFGEMARRVMNYSPPGNFTIVHSL